MKGCWLCMCAVLVLAAGCSGKKDPAPKNTPGPAEAKPDPKAGASTETPSKPDGAVAQADPEEKPVAVPPASDVAGRLKVIAERTAQAKTSKEFLEIITLCGELEIAGVAEQKQLRNDPAFIKACRVSPTKTRAALAIAESTGDSKSTHCLSASMNLEELVKAGIEKEALSGLLKQVNEVCGL